MDDDFVKFAAVLPCIAITEEFITIDNTFNLASDFNFSTKTPAGTYIT